MRTGQIRLLLLLCGTLFPFTSLAATAPNWDALLAYQQTITRERFEVLLTNRYAPHGALDPYLVITDDAVTVYSTRHHDGSPVFRLRLATPNGAPDPPSSATFETPASLQARRNPTNAPLRGLRVVLDPGHIGGEWARIEERFFVGGQGDRPVQEAVLNLLVARHLRDRLAAAGATVLFTKDDFQPVTALRPSDFRADAEADVAADPQYEQYPPLEREAAIADAVRHRAEWLFYRRAEIAARARLVNESLHPDLTLCLHFNAVAWDERRSLVDDNRLVVFVHGTYLPGELAADAQKFNLFTKLLEHSADLELGIADHLATELARATGLPPVRYAVRGVAHRVGNNPYLYARNLAANRLIRGPVVFLEPYYQNNRTVYRRLQLGDFDGTREIDGHQYPSIFREYADAVARGVIGFYAPLTTKDGATE
ncbi:N-acetylmuramoyl-L-alanine amidase [bacterium]|nr:N-acetylmuramoyl-L-alanine amidase [bacterium]